MTPLVTVLGASGGVGASTWAAALARRLAAHFGECVLVDGDLRAGGLDMTCGVEHLPGLRWPDLARLRGVTSASRLVAALPRGEVPVLSADGRGEGVPASVVADVLASLAGRVAVVVDAGDLADDGSWADVVRGSTAVHVVAGLGARQVADAEALLARIGPGPVSLLLRSRRRVGESVLTDLVEHLGVPLAAHVVDDPRLARSVERGDWPGHRGGVRDAAEAVARALVSAPGAGDNAGVTDPRDPVGPVGIDEVGEGAGHVGPVRRSGARGAATPARDGLDHPAERRPA